MSADVTGAALSAATARGHRMLVWDIATRAVVTTSPTATLRAAAKTMDEHGIGAVVVLDGDALAGILSERDILHAVAAGVGLDADLVATHMSTPVITVGAAWAIHEAAATMTEHRVRHLVVTDESRVVGVLSIRDVLLAGQRVDLGDGMWAVLRDPMTFTIRERRRLQRQLLALGAGPIATLDLDPLIAELVGSWSFDRVPDAAAVAALEPAAHARLREAVEQELPDLQLSVHPAPGWRDWTDWE